MSESGKEPWHRHDRRRHRQRDDFGTAPTSPSSVSRSDDFVVDIDPPSAIAGESHQSGADFRGSDAEVFAVIEPPEGDFVLLSDEKSADLRRVPDSAAPKGHPSPPVVSAILGEIRWPQIVIGVPSPEVEPAAANERFRTFPFRPDTIIDGWSNDVVTVRGASLRGHLHRHNGAPRQDDFAVHLMPDGRIIAVVADGVSAAEQSQLGSTIAVRQATQWLYSQMPGETAETDWMSLVNDAAWALIQQTQAILQLDEPDPGKAEQQLATTLLCAVIESAESGGLRAFIIGVGDSGAWVLRDGEFISVLGGKAPDEGGISSSAVAGLPRRPTKIEPSVVEVGPNDVLLLGTDGIGDPLGGGQGGVGNLFRALFNGTEPPSLGEFAHAMDFSRETFDDDRTLVAVMPRRDPLRSRGSGSSSKMSLDAPGGVGDDSDD